MVCEGNGKWALVTGATGGIGAEMCAQLAQRGWNIVLSGRSEERLAALAAKLGLAEGRWHAVTADLASASGAAELAEKVDGLGIEVELLVNNAGLGYDVPFVEGELARQRALVQVNVVSLTELAHIFGARMAERGHGSIINVASVAAVMPGPGMSTYFASKAYALSLSQAMHEELTAKGVRVLALCPGPVRTGFWNVAGANVSAIDPIMLTPEEVSRIALVALDHNRAVCAPGVLSKACYGFGRVAPAWLSRKVAHVFNGK